MQTGDEDDERWRIAIVEDDEILLPVRVETSYWWRKGIKEGLLERLFGKEKLCLQTKKLHWSSQEEREEEARVIVKRMETRSRKDTEKLRDFATHELETTSFLWNSEFFNLFPPWNKN